MTLIRRLSLPLVSMGALIGVFIGGLQAQAAEKVTLKYGPFYRSVSVAELKDYASSGKTSGSLTSLLGVVGSDQRQSLLGLLNTTLPYDVLQVDRLLRSPLGEQLLKDMAAATILPGAEGTEALALRSAAVTAAAADKQLSFVTLLEKYPVPTLTVDLPLLMQVLKSNPALGALIKAPAGGAAPNPQTAQ
ncbi:alpha/beta hydrolase [Lyngbya confervoides]|uniref:Alpha/beta hydrolase n=1 Tax=Lyngbya confervoides BDU141951 TaxID=1574623 RepID=A0ABD4SYJ5_9CYAN|nr:alpha/beta hydrolase [Lyngbya confervoides]MCM1981374.1 alpha/beta hydrolase [Lyngbya confervoides BDU141951]